MELIQNNYNDPVISKHCINCISCNPVTSICLNMNSPYVLKEVDAVTHCCGDFRYKENKQR